MNLPRPAIVHLPHGRYLEASVETLLRELRVRVRLHAPDIPSRLLLELTGPAALELGSVLCRFGQLVDGRRS